MQIWPETGGEKEGRGISVESGLDEREGRHDGEEMGRTGRISMHETRRLYIDRF